MNKCVAFFAVNELPNTLEPDAFYYVKDGEKRAKGYLTNQSGEPFFFGAVTIQQGDGLIVEESPNGTSYEIKVDFGFDENEVAEGKATLTALNKRLEKEKNLSDLDNVEEALVNLNLGGIQAQVQANTDALSAMVSASCQFGSNIAQSVPKLADGFNKDLKWENIKLNSNPAIIEVEEDKITFKRAGTYQFISHLALRRKSGTGGQANIHFQLYIDNLPFNSEFHESVTLEVGSIRYLPVMTLIDLEEEDLGVMTVRAKMGGPADVEIVEFNSTLVSTQTAGGGGTAEYPDMDGNAGKVLAVNNEEDGVEWVEQSGGDAECLSCQPMQTTYQTMIGSSPTSGSTSAFALKGYVLQATTRVKIPSFKVILGGGVYKIGFAKLSEDDEILKLWTVSGITTGLGETTYREKAIALAQPAVFNNGDRILCFISRTDGTATTVARCHFPANENLTSLYFGIKEDENLQGITWENNNIQTGQTVTTSSTSSYSKISLSPYVVAMLEENEGSGIIGGYAYQPSIDDSTNSSAAYSTKGNIWQTDKAIAIPSVVISVGTGTYKAGIGIINSSNIIEEIWETAEQESTGTSSTMKEYDLSFSETVQIPKNKRFIFYITRTDGTGTAINYTPFSVNMSARWTIKTGLIDERQYFLWDNNAPAVGNTVQTITSNQDHKIGFAPFILVRL